MKLPTWGDAVREILQHAGVPEAQVAERVGVNRAITNRHLNGARRPSAAMIAKINGAVADLVGIGTAEYYLKAIAAWEADDLETVMRYSAGPGSELQLYLRDGFVDALSISLATHHEKADLRSLAKIVIAHRHRIIMDIAGPAPKKTWFEELIVFFDEVGFDWRAWLRPNSECAAVYMLERFDMVVRQALAEATSDLILRQRLRNRIRDAYGEIQRRRWDPNAEDRNWPSAIQLPWEAIASPRPKISGEERVHIVPASAGPVQKRRGVA